MKHFSHAATFGAGALPTITVVSTTALVTLCSCSTAYESEQMRIACWGDSLTEGVGAGPAIIEKDGMLFDASYHSYPQILESLTGIPTINYGVSGATSEEVVYLQRMLSLLDRSGALGKPSLMTTKPHEDDVLVLEFGSNGGWKDDYQILIEQYRELIHQTGCEKYIIVGDTDDPGTSIADERQEPLPEGRGTEETAWEAALCEAFNDHFINMRVFLVEQGLEVAGLEATEEDDEAASLGCISEQLRSDWTHLNSYGYFAQAMAIFEKGQELGYW